MRTPITYYGGKQLMADKIVQLMPAHRIYVEPFFGGGSVFFAKAKSYLEVINDTNDRLITFYRQVVDNFDELFHLVQTSLHSESEYNRAKKIYYGKMQATEVEIAWAVWITTNFSFSGSPSGGWKWCNGSSGSHSAIYMERKRADFTSALHDRLAKVQISCRDALNVISQRDTPNTLFYLDPPYPGCEQKHYRGYTFDDLEALLDLLSSIKGKFILSNYWSSLLHEYVQANGWAYMEFDLPLRVANLTKSKRKLEVLVSNFSLKEPSLFDL